MLLQVLDPYKLQKDPREIHDFHSGNRCCRVMKTRLRGDAGGGAGGRGMFGWGGVEPFFPPTLRTVSSKSRQDPPQQRLGGGGVQESRRIAHHWRPRCSLPPHKDFGQCNFVHSSPSATEFFFFFAAKETTQGHKKIK